MQCEHGTSRRLCCACLQYYKNALFYYSPWTLTRNTSCSGFKLTHVYSVHDLQRRDRTKEFRCVKSSALSVECRPQQEALQHSRSNYHYACLVAEQCGCWEGTGQFLAAQLWFLDTWYMCKVYLGSTRTPYYHVATSLLTLQTGQHACVHALQQFAAGILNFQWKRSWLLV